MMPCCESTYEKYLDNSGEVVPSEVEKSKERLRERLQKQGVAEANIVKRVARVGTCLCTCHYEGVNILH